MIRRQSNTYTVSIGVVVSSKIVVNVIGSRVAAEVSVTEEDDRPRHPQADEMMDGSSRSNKVGVGRGRPGVISYRLAITLVSRDGGITEPGRVVAPAIQL